MFKVAKSHWKHCQKIVERPEVQRVVKGPLVLCGSNKCQNCLKMSGNMLVNLMIQNSRFYYIFDIRRNYGFNIQNIRKICLLGFSIQRNTG